MEGRDRHDAGPFLLWLRSDLGQELAGNRPHFFTAEGWRSMLLLPLSQFLGITF